MSFFADPPNPVSSVPPHHVAEGIAIRGEKEANQGDPFRQLMIIIDSSVHLCKCSKGKLAQILLLGSVSPCVEDLHSSTETLGSVSSILLQRFFALALIFGPFRSFARMGQDSSFLKTILKWFWCWQVPFLSEDGKQRTEECVTRWGEPGDFYFRLFRFICCLISHEIIVDEIISWRLSVTIQVIEKYNLCWT